MFRRDNNGRVALNRTILDRAIRYRIGFVTIPTRAASVITFGKDFPLARP